MENDIFKQVVDILTLVMGVLIPILVIFIKRILKDADDDLKERDEKINKLFSICDEFRVCLTNKAQEISSIKTDIKWIKEALQKRNGD